MNDAICIRHPGSTATIAFGEVNYCPLCLQEFLDRHSVERMRELTPDERAALAKQEIDAKAAVDKEKIDKDAVAEKDRVAKKLELARAAAEDEKKDREAEDKVDVDTEAKSGLTSSTVTEPAYGEPGYVYEGSQQPAGVDPATVNTPAQPAIAAGGPPTQV